MNYQHKAIRALLTSMAPNRSTAYIKAFNLREPEEAYLIECDVKGKSHVEVAREYHVSPETVAKTRYRAYAKITDQINNSG